VLKKMGILSHRRRKRLAKAAMWAAPREWSSIQTMAIR
jgi:hypothetical protein